MKVRSDGNLAGDVFIYIDDGRIIAHSELVCCQASKRFFSICNSIGIQDATRKLIETSLTTGPWAGKGVHTWINEVVITVMEVKWLKKGVFS